MALGLTYNLLPGVPQLSVPIGQVETDPYEKIRRLEKGPRAPHFVVPCILDFFESSQTGARKK